MRSLFVLIIMIFASLIGAAQSSSCNTATAFCTSSGLTYPASTGTSSPSGPNYGCLFTQPNPAFFFLQIGTAGNLTLNLYSTPANDIDFICWGPFTDPNTMCNNLTGGNIEDCSYSASWNETCQINNAAIGDYYVILITNYSNSACNINFSQTGGNGSTDCCIAGDAGNNNSIDICESDPNFNMQNELGGNPDNGGDWYDSGWNYLTSNNFDPAINLSGTYAYVVQGNVISGASIPCPSDTSYLTVNVNSSPIVNIPPYLNLCDNDQAITLNTGTPAGGTYSVNGMNSTTFTPSVLNIGNNTIVYTYIDGNGCSAISSENLIVDTSPFATATTTNASCSGYTDGIATLNLSTSTISSYVWSDGQTTQTANNLTAGIYSYIITDINGCSFSDSIIIYEPGGITATLNTTNITCNGGSNGTISVNLQGTSAPPGNISLLSYCTSTPGANTNSTIDNVQLTGDNFNINNNTTGNCDQYEDYTNLYADVTEGQNYNIDISLGDCLNNYPSGGKVFIDWNIDGDFNDPGEEVGIIPNLVSSTVSLPITIPFTGVYGATRIRIVSQFLNNTSVNSIGACDVGVMANPIYIQPWFGATEDYSIVINSASVSATYLWNNFATTDSLANLIAGTYTVDITDQNGCVLTESVTLTEPSPLTVSTSTTNINCNNGTDGSISLNISGGNPNYTISIPPYSQTLNNGISSFSTPQLLSSGIYSYSITDSSGCEITNSVILTNPAQLSSITTINTCDPYNWNGNTYTSNIIHVDTLTSQNGCDSLATLDLTILNSSSSNILISACDTYTWNGNTYTSSTIDTMMSINTNGCTHIDSLILTINNSDSTIDIYSVCDTLSWIDGITYTTSNNTSFITSTNAYGCDSVIYLDLTINNSTSSYLNATSCNTYNWTANNQIYNTSGTYTYTTINSNGCIHTDTLNLIINSPNSGVDNIFACNTYLWNGISYSNSGTYTDTLTNIYGCDSIATINLIISDTSYLTTKETQCGSFLWSVNNLTYTNSGTYIVIGNDPITGCVHIDSLILIINAASFRYDTISACDSYTWVNGVTYTSSNNSVTYITTNTVGCDSIVELNLEISYSNSSSFSIAECDNYTWEGTTYNTSNSYQKIFNTINGCDSVVTLNLIIINGSQDITTIISKTDIKCFNINDGAITLYPSGGIPPFSYLWSNGETTQSINNLTAGDYMFTITDSLGCTLDSTSTIINQANEIFLDFTATSPICRHDSSILSIHISNSLSNTYSMSLLDSTLESFIIDTNGLLIPEGVPIRLTPNFSGKALIVSLTDNNSCTRYFNDSVHIEVKPLPQLTINENDICVGESSYILNNASPNGGTYFINNVMTNYFDVENLETGSYDIKYEYTDPITSCSNSVIESINIKPSPIAQFSYSPQITTILDPKVNLINTSENIISNEWIIGDGSLIEDQFNFIHNFQDTGEYNIIYFVSNASHCIDSTTSTITIYPHYSSYIPSAFTPNNDGKNDIFEPQYSGTNSYTIRIYDKWGGLVYKGENIGWDGTQNGELVQNGTYSYSISVQDYKYKSFIYTGIVTLTK